MLGGPGGALWAPKPVECAQSPKKHLGHRHAWCACPFDAKQSLSCSADVDVTRLVKVNSGGLVAGSAWGNMQYSVTVEFTVVRALTAPVCALPCGSVTFVSCTES